MKGLIEVLIWNGTKPQLIHVNDITKVVQDGETVFIYIGENRYTCKESYAHVVAEIKMYRTAPKKD